MVISHTCLVFASQSCAVQTKLSSIEFLMSSIEASHHMLLINPPIPSALFLQRHPKVPRQLLRLSNKFINQGLPSPINIYETRRATLMLGSFLMAQRKAFTQLKPLLETSRGKTHLAQLSPPQRNRTCLIANRLKKVLTNYMAMQAARFVMANHRQRLHRQTSLVMKLYLLSQSAPPLQAICRAKKSQWGMESD